MRNTPAGVPSSAYTLNAARAGIGCHQVRLLAFAPIQADAL